MFTLATSTFGKFSKLILKNELTGEYVSIIPERGATVHELFLLKNGTLGKVLDNFATDAELEANHGHKSSILMPYPNRIRNGIYTFQNKEYHLPITKLEEGNAKDGFICASVFGEMGSELSESAGSVTLGFSYKGNEQGYPFPFSTEVTYALSESNFSISIKVTNTGLADMPIGIGWHPYYLLHDLSSAELQIPESNRLIVENLIPTGDTEEYKDFVAPAPIGYTQFDTCFKPSGDAEEQVVKLYDHAADCILEAWQQSGKRKYEYVQIYIPKDRESIAIEPMTCPPNSFNSHDSLIILKSEEAFRTTSGVRIKRA